MHKESRLNTHYCRPNRQRPQRNPTRQRSTTPTIPTIRTAVRRRRMPLTLVATRLHINITTRRLTRHRLPHARRLRHPARDLNRGQQRRHQRRDDRDSECNQMMDTSMFHVFDDASGG